MDSLWFRSWKDFSFGLGLQGGPSNKNVCESTEHPRALENGISKLGVGSASFNQSAAVHGSCPGADNISGQNSGGP